MENIKLHRWLIGIFTSIILIFAMSHNASAITPVIDLNDYELYRHVTYPVNDCTFTGGTDYFTGRDSFCRVTANGFTTINSIKSHETYTVNKGDIVNFYFFVYTQAGYNSSILPKLENISNNLLGWDLISINQVLNDDYKTISDFSGVLGVDGTFNNTEYPGYSVYRVYELTMKSNQSGNLLVGLNTGGGIFSMRDINSQFIYSIKFLRWFRQSESKENKEVEEKTQEAVDGSENAGNSSSQDAQSGTTGLLNAINGAISVITSASPTNCKINGNMGNLDIGQIDLCANPVPSFIQTIGSLLLILMCVPLAISLFNRFIALFRSFQS